MHYVDLVAVLAICQLLFFGVMTGMARGKSGIKAPATTGDEGFERMYRVQVNTLETIVAFLPALFIAGKYWSPVWVASIGLVYWVGRFRYWRAYVTEPSSRGLGFVLTIVPTFVLLVLALIGAIFS